MGALCGYTAGAALVNAGGSTGLWAREIGWQAHQIAARNRVPELAQNVTTTAQRIARATASEMKALSAQPTIAEARRALITMVAAAWDKARAWAETSGVAASLLSLRVATFMPISPYVQNLWLLTDKARNPDERLTHDYLVYFKTSDFFPWELRQAASSLRLTTKPEDRVQTYGMDPYVLFLAQRKSATPYIYAYDLTADAALAGGNLPAPVGLHPTPAEAARIVAIRDAHEKDFFEKIQAKPPAAFVFHDKAPLITWQEAVHDFKEHCPASSAWVDAHYTLTANFNGLRVFLRNDLAPGAPRFDVGEAPPSKD
jgi:predicted nucleic acid-binding Zn ribbon protein